MEADLAFHRVVIEGIGTRRLARAHDALRAEIQIFLAQRVNRYAFVLELVRQHRQLLGVIEDGGPSAAEAAIHERLGQSTTWLTRQTSPDAPRQ